MTLNPERALGGAVNERWLREAERQLRGAGFRLGARRERVLEELARATCLQTAADVGEALQMRGERVATATVYRTLDVLEDLGLLHRLETGTGSARFEIQIPGEGGHHHALCGSCGRVLPFRDSRVEHAVDAAVGDVGFSASRYDVVAYGRCAACEPRPPLSRRPVA
jgi:Fur family ferric uptake transcriptional regulator